MVQVRLTVTGQVPLIRSSYVKKFTSGQSGLLRVTGRPMSSGSMEVPHSTVVSAGAQEMMIGVSQAVLQPTTEITWVAEAVFPQASVAVNVRSMVYVDSSGPAISTSFTSASTVFLQSEAQTFLGTSGTSLQITVTSSGTFINTGAC